MASTTRSLAVTKTGYIKQQFPSTVYQTDSETEYKISRDFITSSTSYYNGLAFGFGAFPDSLKYQVIYGCTFEVYGSGQGGVFIKGMEDFDPLTLTYNNRKEINISGASSYPYMNGQTGWTDLQSIWSTLADATVQSMASAIILRNKAYYVYGMAARNGDVQYAKTVMSDAGAPGVTVSYDDAVTVKSKISVTQGIGYGGYPNMFNASIDQEVTWELVRDSTEVYYCLAETFEQQSATFYWREQGQSAWNQIAVNGSTKSVTVPANTFTSGGITYEYYISATDTLGHSSSTDVGTCMSATNLIKVLYGSEGDSPWFYYYNPHEPLTFYWEVYSVGTSADDHQVGTPGNIKMIWKVFGGEEHEITVPQTGATQYTAPADTFPAVEWLQYKFTGTDSTGVDLVVPSYWYRFSTEAKVIDSVAVAPLGTVEVYNQEITFEWQFESYDQSQPSRYVLKWRVMGNENWTTLVDSNTPATTYTAPPNTFPVGQIEWCVIAYNVDSTAGNFTVNSFVSYGAPEAPLVSATAVPFTEISWISYGQQAYEIDIDGTVYGPYFGIDKSFTVPNYLEDGEHVIKVRVMGLYNLWSDYSSVTIDVENVPGDQVIISGESALDAVLSLQTSDAPNYYIYRDGELIAHTQNSTYTDRFVLGEHTYYVINRLPGGYYSISYEVTLTMEAVSSFIALLAGGEWINIRYSSEQNPPSFQHTGTAAYFHLTGSVFPSAFVGIFQDQTISMTVSFDRNHEAQRQQLTELFGQAVILKFRDGTVFICVIDSWSVERNKSFYTSYTFTARRIDWRDFVDDTNG